MSLKSFHIFFIVISILFCFGFGVWEFGAYRTETAIGELLAGIVSFGAGVGLIVYLIQFVKKLKNVRPV